MGDADAVATRANKMLPPDVDRDLFRPQARLRDVKPAVLPDQVWIGDARKLDALEQRGVRRVIAVIVDYPLVLRVPVVLIDEVDAPAVRLLGVRLLPLETP